MHYVYAVTSKEKFLKSVARKTEHQRHLLVTDCCSRKNQLIIVCGANAHHILWESTGTNPRRERFKEYLVSSNLIILNQGYKPTFVVRNRKEVTDLTLGTNKIGNFVTGMYLMSHLCQTTGIYAFKYVTQL
jgi:hypothetical protein